MALVREPSKDAVIDFLLRRHERDGREVTDTGAHLMFVKVGQVLTKYGAKHVRVTTYHKPGSGDVERLNRDIKSPLQIADEESQDRRQYPQSCLSMY